jgi:hypothetical protein
MAPENRPGATFSMPSLIRFLVVVGLVGGLAYGGLYVLSAYFEPEQTEVSKPVSGVKIRRQ